MNAEAKPLVRMKLNWEGRRKEVMMGGEHDKSLTST